MCLETVIRESMGAGSPLKSHRALGRSGDSAGELTVNLVDKSNKQLFVLEQGDVNSGRGQRWRADNTRRVCLAEVDCNKM